MGNTIGSGKKRVLKKSNQVFYLNSNKKGMMESEVN